MVNGFLVYVGRIFAFSVVYPFVYPLILRVFNINAGAVVFVFLLPLIYLYLVSLAYFRGAVDAGFTARAIYALLSSIVIYVLLAIPVGVAGWALGCALVGVNCE